MRIGAQLYTVRDYCQTPDGFAEALARVAELGFSDVQVSGTCEYEGEWLAEQLKKNGLRCGLTHIELSEITDDPDALAAKHRLFGCSRIGIGYMPNEFRGSPESVNRFCDLIAPAAHRIRELGGYLMYHNHAFEYEAASNGKTYMELLFERFDPEELGFTLDTYWVRYGRADPVSEIRRLSGRIPCVHFKDMEITAEGERRYCPVGAGMLDFEGILSTLEGSGCETAFIEQDDCFGADPFDCLKQSYAYLKSLGLS